jgi:cell division septum initiation protein DivIVA
MDIAARIQQLEDMVKEAKSMPLSSSALLNRDELLEVVNGLKEALPEEIKQARWVVKDREELLVKARRDAEALVEKAKAEQAHLLSEQTVVQDAQAEAERLLADARVQIRQMRLEAEDYVDGKLAQFEAAITRIQEALTGADEALTKVRGQVEAGREKLRGSHPAQALAPQETAASQEGESR